MKWEGHVWESAAVACPRSVVLLRKNAVCAIVWVVSEVSWAFFFCTLWDFSSLPSDQPEPLSAEAQSRNHWTAREFPELFFFFKWNFYLEEQLADKTIVIWIGTFAKCVLKNEWWKALTSKKAIVSSYCDNKTLSFQAKPRIFGKLVSTNMTLSTSYYVLFWYQ